MIFFLQKTGLETTTILVQHWPIVLNNLPPNLQTHFGPKLAGANPEIITFGEPNYVPFSVSLAKATISDNEEGLVVLDEEEEEEEDEKTPEEKM
jgi:hypothetical protein